MPFSVSLYSIIFIITVALSILAAVFAWRKRLSPGGWPLFFMMLAVTEWNLMNFMEASSTILQHKILWSKLAYLGIQTTPVLFLIFALQYTERKRWMNRCNIALLFAIPLITLLLVATNEYHHLIWNSFTPGEPGTNSIIYGHGFWFWVSTVYINSTLAWSTVIIFLFALRSKEIYQTQVYALIISTALPWIGFTIYLSDLNPFPGLDLTAIALAISGVILVLIILQLHFLDLIPIAREILIEEMVDGIIILDYRQRIVDINLTARQMLGLQNVPCIGQPAIVALHNRPEFLVHLEQGQPAESIITVEQPEIRHIDLRLSLLQRGTDKVHGHLFLLRDVTRLVETSQALDRTNQELHKRINEIETLQAQLREQTIRDPLTGLYNRRYLRSALTKEQSRALRKRYSIGFLMLDIDHFKNLNDTYGHNAGDQVLVALGNFLQTAIRADDIVFRLGGEEFLVVLIDINIAELMQRAETLRRGFEELSVTYQEKLLHATISIGVALYPQHGEVFEDLIRKADEALYGAKHDGRNCVRVWTGDS